MGAEPTSIACDSCRFIDYALSDWILLKEISLGIDDAAIQLLSQRLGCSADDSRTIQLVDKLRVYLSLPFPLRLLLQQHNIVLSSLPLDRLTFLLDSPPEVLAAELDNMASPPGSSPSDVPTTGTGPVGAARGRKPAKTAAAAPSGNGTPLPAFGDRFGLGPELRPDGGSGAASGAGPGSTLRLFFRSGWLVFDPTRPGLAGAQHEGRKEQQQQQQQQPGRGDERFRVAAPVSDHLAAAVAGRAGAAEPPGQRPTAQPQQPEQQPHCWAPALSSGQCRYVWRPGPPDPNLDYTCGPPAGAPACSGVTSGAPPAGRKPQPSRVQAPACRTLAAVVGAPPVPASPGRRSGTDIVGADTARLVRFEYDMYGTPGCHLQRHPLIGALLDRLLFIRLSAELRPRPRRSYRAPTPSHAPAQPSPAHPRNGAPAGDPHALERVPPAASAIDAKTTRGLTGNNLDAGAASVGSASDPLAALLTHGLVLGGRLYRRLVVKDAGKAGDKVCFFAQDTLSPDDVRHGFRSLGPPSSVRRLVADVETAVAAARRAVVDGAAAAGKTGEQGERLADPQAAAALDRAAAAAAAKAASRPELFLSPTWPLDIDAMSVSYVDDVQGVAAAGDGSAGSGWAGGAGAGKSGGSEGPVNGTGGRWDPGTRALGAPVVAAAANPGNSADPATSSSRAGAASGTLVRSAALSARSAPSGDVMTDGNGLICARLAGTIPFVSHGMLLAPSPAAAQPLKDAAPQSVHSHGHPGFGACAGGGAGASPAAAEAAAVGPGGSTVEPALQLRVYDPRVGAVVKGTFTPVVSGLPPGTSLLVRASQVKGPSWADLQSRLTLAAGSETTPAPGCNSRPAPEATLAHASARAPAPNHQVAAPAALELTLSGLVTSTEPGRTQPPAVLTRPGLGDEPRAPQPVKPQRVKRQRQKQPQSRPLLPSTQMAPGTAVPAAAAAEGAPAPGLGGAGVAAQSPSSNAGTDQGAALASAAPGSSTAAQGAGTVCTGSGARCGGSAAAALVPGGASGGGSARVPGGGSAGGGSALPAVLEVVRKLPARPGAVARLNGPLMLLLSACCVSARTLYGVLEEELARVKAVQRGEVAAAWEMVRRGSETALEAALAAERAADEDAVASGRERGCGRGPSEAALPAGNQPRLTTSGPCTGASPEASGVPGVGIDFGMRELLQGCAARAWQQLWGLRLPLRHSATFTGVPDPSGSIPEGCVVALPGPHLQRIREALRLRTCGSSMPRPAEHDQHVVVYRFPGLHPGDLRKLKLIPPPPELLRQLGLAPLGQSGPPTQGGTPAADQKPRGQHQQLRLGSAQSGLGAADVGAQSGGDEQEAAGGGLAGVGNGGGAMLVFSVRGPRSPVAAMSGGDYDGDQYVLIWDQRIVREFEEFPGSRTRALPLPLPPLSPPLPLHRSGSEPQPGTRPRNIPAVEPGGNKAPAIGAPGPQPSPRDPQTDRFVERDDRHGGTEIEPFVAELVVLGPPAAPEPDAVSGSASPGGPNPPAGAEEADAERWELAEEEYLTRRYFFCHEAAAMLQEAYRLWYWSADEYGADHPYSLMLCRLYNEALDAPKSGAFRRIPLQLRAKLRPPHWAIPEALQQWPHPAAAAATSGSPAARAYTDAREPAAGSSTTSVSVMRAESAAGASGFGDGAARSRGPPWSGALASPAIAAAEAEPLPNHGRAGASGAAARRQRLRQQRHQQQHQHQQLYSSPHETSGLQTRAPAAGSVAATGPSPGPGRPPPAGAPPAGASHQAPPGREGNVSPPGLMADGVEADGWGNVEGMDQAEIGDVLDGGPGIRGFLVLEDLENGAGALAREAASGRPHPGGRPHWPESGLDSRSQTFEPPRQPVPPASWLRSRSRHSSSVLAGFYEILQLPENRLPRLDPRLLGQDLPLVRHVERVLATHGSVVRANLEEHWARAADEMDQLTVQFAPLWRLRRQDTVKEGQLIYQHQRQHREDERWTPTKSALGSRTVSSSPAADLAAEAFQPLQSDLLRRALHGAGPLFPANTSVESRGTCPCWQRLLTRTADLPASQAPSQASQELQPQRSAAAPAPRLCPPERCRAAGAAGALCTQQAALSCMSALYERQWQRIQSAAAVGRRVQPRLRLLWSLFGPLLPELRRRAAAIPGA